MYSSNRRGLKQRPHRAAKASDKRNKVHLPRHTLEDEQRQPLAMYSTNNGVEIETQKSYDCKQSKNFWETNNEFPRRMLLFDC
jgi:hypothetical protein